MPQGPTPPQHLPEPFHVIVDGVQSAAAIPGPTGPTGPKGDTGESGNSGPSGPIGAPGAKGETGSTGASGAPGSSGSQGPSGPRGDTGPSGLVGPTGSTGPSGIAGAQGDRGITGFTGSIGPQGIAGPVGVTGNVGPTGVSGSNATFRNASTAGLSLKVYTMSASTDSSGTYTFTLPSGYFSSVYGAFAQVVRDTNTASSATFVMVRRYSTVEVVVQCFESKTTGVLIGGNVEGLEATATSVTVELLVLGV